MLPRTEKRTQTQSPEPNTESITLDCHRVFLQTWDVLYLDFAGSDRRESRRTHRTSWHCVYPSGCGKCLFKATVSHKCPRLPPHYSTRAGRNRTPVELFHSPFRAEWFIQSQHVTRGAPPLWFAQKVFIRRGISPRDGQPNCWLATAFLWFWSGEKKNYRYSSLNNFILFVNRGRQ